MRNPFDSRMELLKQKDLTRRKKEKNKARIGK